MQVLKFLSPEFFGLNGDRMATGLTEPTLSIFAGALPKRLVKAGWHEFSTVVAQFSACKLAKVREGRCERL